ncbi:rho GTPase-activating protein 11A isoform X2 [Salmo salar]|uniref:Rho GTPase-activating protein 11A isoform X2 n=1 Tax=Salmo salar TaxID=8030 RepID=A0A1S3SNM7_SALSA|nr:rho GTPase-activating protein 11A-like isoform X2 [Salmo salar]|eukprot:XP_014065948.1 PREDICTED: rho GTPase-activating protein 11A-like isoform X2 [Salmo salar]
MKFIERNVMRLAVVQHLRATYGIKTKNWNKNKSHTNCKLTVSHSVKVFGVPLESLPQYNVENGSVPCFLMDACTSLLEHVDTEGLFRKSGSIVRLKALRAKLDKGEECLSTALPCDVAGLVKQFFRELPDPVLPTELHDAFLKAQQLPTEEERTSATLLLSCVLPDRNMSILHYFFTFLHKVSQSGVNKMDSSNLSVILAPNLLHAGDGADKMNASTEKRLKQQAAVVHCLIERALDFGVVPQFIMEKIPALLGCEAVLSPTLDGLEELDTNSGTKRRHRRSLGDMVNGARNKLKTNRTPTNTPQSDGYVFSSTPVIITPNSKRKLPLESGQSYGSSKKRRSIKKNLVLELLPNALFGGSSTPVPGYMDPGASESLNSSQNALSSIGRSSRQCASSARRKSKRLSHRHVVNRVESGKAGCFSPKVTKKENVCKSLRLRFSLGKSSRDPKEGSESIGWRLATQESTTSFRFTKDAEFSPTVLQNKSSSNGSKFYSKSEDNLLTPQCDDGSALRTSWSGETADEGLVLGGGSFTDTPMNMCLNNNYYSEPAIVVAKPPMVASFPKKLCCGSSAESLESEGSFSQSQTGPTLLKLKRAFTESGSDLQAVPRGHSAPSGEDKASQPENTETDSTPSQSSTLKGASPNKESSSMPTPHRCLADDQNITFGQIKFVPLSLLSIDSTLFEVGGCGSLSEKACDRSLCAGDSGDRSVEEEAETVADQVNCSRLIDALDIQSPAHFTRSMAAGVQTTPYRASGLEYFQELNTPLPPMGTVSVMVDDNVAVASPEPSTHPQRQEHQQVEQPSPSTLETCRVRVADHIQRFNKLVLYSPKSQAKAVRSPLKFQRTPVRQSVRRINSLLVDRRPAVVGNTSSRAQDTPTPVGKAVSLESGLSAGAQLQPYQCQADNQRGLTNDKGRSTKTRPPPVPPKKTASIIRKPRNCALGDVTNKLQPKAKGDTPIKNSPGGEGQKSVVQQVAEKDVCCYRGSPRNPLNDCRLLSATKPIDL